MPKFPRAELEDAFRSYVRREAGIEIYRVTSTAGSSSGGTALAGARRTTRSSGTRGAGLLKARSAA